MSYVRNDLGGDANNFCLPELDRPAIVDRLTTEMDKATASTMLTKNGSCAESRVTSLNVLRTCLAEHFGVMYRNYLAPDATGVAPARILIPDYV